ncbi:adenosine deaminase-like protein [Vespula squamosa]|uniref:Adenosine deaminase-like protein n=1 Tax=Vespula squamosa TaxID=30214 RepID=A0ABD1ZXG6_VESSQ
MDLQNFCRRLPKIELHAHLNGSLTLSTLEKIYRMTSANNMAFEKFVHIIQAEADLKECFKLFNVIYSLTVTPQAIYIATCEVIKDFMEDNVIYLELRSTPRYIPGQMTKTEYIGAMIDAVSACKRTCPGIIVRLLISVDRAQDYENAKENCTLAKSYSKKFPDLIIGVDLSGDPAKGNLYLDLLHDVRKAGLKVVIHCAEIPNRADTWDVLKFRPDRIGHGTCIHPNLGGTVSTFDYLRKSRIPVELCLTSNVKCETVPSYEDHQFKYLYESGHPICISTDDKGLYDTTLSKEFEIASTTFDLKKDDLINICKSSIECSFNSKREKSKLLNILNDFDKRGKTLSKHP